MLILTSVSVLRAMNKLGPDTFALLAMFSSVEILIELALIGELLGAI